MGSPEGFHASFFDLTPNLTGDPVLDADFLTFSTGVPTTTFNVGSDVYTLKLFGFSQDSGATILDHFTLPEDQSTRASLYGEITPSAQPPPPVDTTVPEPATLSMTALGLSLAGWMRRRCADTSA